MTHPGSPEGSPAAGRGSSAGGCPSRVAVLGLGLIGGSLARRLVEYGCTVLGWDPDGDTRVAARSAGIEILPSAQDLARSDVELLIVAVPLRAVEQTADLLAGLLPAATVVTDVASVKTPVRAAMVRVGLGDRYVGAHPMAGTERSGFDASDPALLTGARWALTLDETTTERAFLMVASMITEIFAGVVLPLTDDVHDEAAALISHVPHVVATELLNLVAHAAIRPVAVGLAAGSFRDGTRVARTTARRTQAMVTDNAAWVVPVLRRAIADLTHLAQALESNGPTSEFFDRADVLRDDGVQALPESQVVRTVCLAELPGWQVELAALGAHGAQISRVDPAQGTILVTSPT